MIALLVVVVTTAASGMLWLSQEADRAAAVAARERMKAVIGVQLGAYADTLQATMLAATGADSLTPATSGMFLALSRPHFDATGVFTLDEEGRIRDAHVVRGIGTRTGLSFDTAIVADLLGRALLDAQTTAGAPARRPTEPSLAAIDGRIVAVVALSEVGTDGGVLAVGLRAMNREELAALAVDQAVGDFTVDVGPLGDEARGFDITATDGESVYHVAWTPERPGQVWRNRIITFTIGPSVIALLLLGLALLHARRVSSELARTQEHVQTLAVRDPLSGLPNRLLFAQRLDQELARTARTGEGLAVMFLDLDRFKEVNDAFGHQAGDELIKQVARRLMTQLRTTDVLARFGGDEFAIIQPGLRSADGAESLAQRILEAIANPFEIEHSAVTVGVSIGIALAPEDAADRETLMRLADTALYQAKNDGRNRHSFFERRMTRRSRCASSSQARSRERHRRRKLVLHIASRSFPPTATTGGGRSRRWGALASPARRARSRPDIISGAAEQSGLILTLGNWVLRRSLPNGRRWPGLPSRATVIPDPVPPAPTTVATRSGARSRRPGSTRRGSSWRLARASSSRTQDAGARSVDDAAARQGREPRPSKIFGTGYCR